MDELCRILTSYAIQSKPKLYDMMIYDFKELSNQYTSNTNEYLFGMKPEYDYLTSEDINELLFYLQNNNVEDILQSIIKQRYPSYFIDNLIVQTMVDYYIECLSSISLFQSYL